MLGMTREEVFLVWPFTNARRQVDPLSGRVFPEGNAKSKGWIWGDRMYGHFPQVFTLVVSSGMSWGWEDPTRHCIPLPWAFSILSQRGWGTMARSPHSQLDEQVGTTVPCLWAPYPWTQPVKASRLTWQASVWPVTLPGLENSSVLIIKTACFVEAMWYIYSFTW